ncbi:hypothetical protein OG474_03225 [Kribbella sp. NBC_01505]|uniref:hypothetical protein n=1 Tax=Kribbella sp. NBC_01505 TaxID=2903580 RepID=UPI00386C7166
MPAREVLIQLLAPALAGRASDGTKVLHTGLWLNPDRNHLFIGLLAEGPAADRPRRPSISISDGDGPAINSFSYTVGSGPGDGHTWLLQARVSAEQASHLAGATFTMDYGDLAVEYTARLTKNLEP